MNKNKNEKIEKNIKKINSEKNTKKILNKKNIIISIAIILGIIIIIFFINNIEIINTENNNIKEILPEQEISDEQIRQTIISLYFYNKETQELEKESRMIDVKLLLQDPYALIIQMLMEGPQKENLETAINKNIKINKIILENNILIINLINENSEEINIEKIINQINKTLTELIEINEIKIVVE